MKTAAPRLNRVFSPDRRTAGKSSGSGAGLPEATGEPLEVAAPVEGFDGFAIGRSIWWDAIDALLTGKAERGEAIRQIARNYIHFVDVYLDA